MVDPIRDYLQQVPEIVRSDLRVPENYVWPSGLKEEPTGIEPVTVDSLSKAVEKILTENSNSVILLRGDYGLGKTNFCYMFGVKLAEQALEDYPNQIIPIYLSLKFAWERDSLFHALAEYINRYGIKISNDQVRDLLFSDREFVLLLDGFDEMANRNDFSRIERMNEMLEEVREIPGVRLLLTTRPSFFNSARAMYAFKYSDAFDLVGFDDTQITEYLKHKDDFVRNTANMLLNKHDDLKEICKTPIRLFFLTDYISKKFEQHYEDHDLLTETEKQFENISLFTLFKYFVEENLKYHAADVKDWDPDDRLAMISKLAFLWYSEGAPGSGANTVFEWEIGDFERFVADYYKEELGEILDDETAARYAKFLTTSTFFMRVRNKFRFWHLSYIEYFVARAMALDIRQEPINLKRWNVPLYSEIYENLFHHLDEYGFENLDIDQIIAMGGFIARANFLVCAYRHRVPQVEIYLRENAIILPQSPLVRYVGYMGLGMYAPSAENIDKLVDAADDETNGIIKALARCVASHWLNEIERGGGTSEFMRFKDRLTTLIQATPDLTVEDADDILGDQNPDLVLRAFKIALTNPESTWSSCAGAILVLSGKRETDDRPLVEQAIERDSFTEAEKTSLHAIYKIAKPVAGW